MIRQANPLIRQADPQEVCAFFKDTGKTVLTLLGYSGIDYEDRAGMLAHAARVLDEADPTTTLLNIGATAMGVGGAYEIARRKGFTTTGIVSVKAKENGTPLSPFVDTVFLIEDATWGGIVKETGQLSPTSTAMVEVSDRIVAIGGNEVSRDEFMAARTLGKPTLFIPADMNHANARDHAAKKELPMTSDFRGALAAALS